MAKENETKFAGGAVPTVGRIVHYVLDRGRAVGRCRPALVVNVLDEAVPVVNLLVGLDGPNDDGVVAVHPDPGDEGVLLMRVVGAHLDPENGLGSWHWPEKVG